MSELGNDTNQPLPPIRQSIEAIQIEQDGKPLVLLQDQEGINEHAIAVTLPGFLIAMMLNGQNTITDVQTAFSKATGSLVSAEEVKSMVVQLEKSDLLETTAFQQKRQEVLNQFLASSIRRPAHSGGGYPENLLELAAFLGKFFQESLCKRTCCFFILRSTLFSNKSWANQNNI